VELMVAISILVILAAIAVPSFNDFSRSQTLSSRAGALHQDMVLARAEAVKLQLNVQIDASSGDWTQGWTVYADANANGKLDSGESKLHEVDALDKGFTMKAANGAGGAKEGIGFNPRGAVVGGGSANLIVCAPGWNKANDSKYARNLRVLPSGRSEVAKGKGNGPGLSCG